MVHGGTPRKISAHTTPLRSSTRSCLCKRRSLSALQAQRDCCPGNLIASNISSHPLLESAVAADMCVSPENLTSSEIPSPYALHSHGGRCLGILLQMI